MVSAVAPGAVVNTDLLQRHLPFLPSERGDESLKPPPAVHGAGFFIEVASSKGFELLAQIRPFRGQNRTPGELPLLAQSGCSVSKLPISQPFPTSGAYCGWGFDTGHDRPNYEILAGE
jgi:hypothetical protein